LYVPAIVTIYLNEVFEDVKGEFHEDAPDGTEVDVVVWVPDDQTNVIVSPTFTVIEFGENDVPPALMVLGTLLLLLLFVE
jgi:hypothetical protein